MSSSDKENRFEEVAAAIDRLLQSDSTREQKLYGICEILNRNLPHYDWVGFYLVDPKNPHELYLGPFIGEPTEHTRIPFGRGICGQAAETGTVFVVNDVSKETNYLSCSLNVKSEIVLPLFRSGEVIGELDVDSHKPGNFNADDRNFLAAICEKVSLLF